MKTKQNKKHIVNLQGERQMIPIKSKIENELHSYVLIDKSNAIIVRGREDKIEYTIIDSGRIAYTQSRYREVWDNKWTLSVLPLRRWYSLRAY